MIGVVLRVWRDWCVLCVLCVLINYFKKSIFWGQNSAPIGQPPYLVS